MHLRWFERKGILFFPASIIGGLISIACLAAYVYLFIDIDSRSHSSSDTLINFVFMALLVAVLYSIIAYFTSSERVKE